ncbi:hypothetical protein ACIQD3_23895 [Peribacillus loiseleuriae]
MQSTEEAPEIARGKQVPATEINLGYWCKYHLKATKYAKTALIKNK